MTTKTQTIEEMEAKLQGLQRRMEKAAGGDDEDKYMRAEDAYWLYVDVLCEKMNTIPIAIKGVAKPGGGYEEETTRVHVIHGCIAAEFVDPDKWRLHHVASGFLIGFWYGRRCDLLQFMTGLDALLRTVGADPQSEDRAKMKNLGEQAHAYGVMKF